jgi:predicted kinase
MPPLVIFIGLQAAGKTTFFTQRFAATHTLVSKDRLRNNRRPDRRQRVLIEEALARGENVVVDNTNPSRAERVAIIEIGRAHTARVVGFFFTASLSECRARNSIRPPTTRVPDVGLLAAAKRLSPPMFDEGFDELWAVETLADFQFATSPWQDPST